MTLTTEETMCADDVHVYTSTQGMAGRQFQHFEVLR